MTVLTDDQRDRLAQFRFAGRELTDAELRELHGLRVDADGQDLPSVLDAERRQDRLRRRGGTVNDVGRRRALLRRPRRSA